MRARDAAYFFLQNDPDLFTNDLVYRNGHRMYEGNARLNKYLHLAQNVHIVQFGKPLFDDTLYAFSNGGVVIDVYKNYRHLKDTYEQHVVDIPEEERSFLKKIAASLHDASVDDLIEISHQDEEWQARRNSVSQEMDSMSRVKEYQERYADVIKIMGLGLC